MSTSAKNLGNEPEEIENLIDKINVDTTDLLKLVRSIHMMEMLKSLFYNFLGGIIVLYSVIEIRGQHFIQHTSFKVLKTSEPQDLEFIC